MSQIDERLAKLEAWAWGKRCSFCGKGQADIGTLIASSSSLICDECVILCVDILFERALQRQRDGGAGSVAEVEFEPPGHDPP